MIWRTGRPNPVYRENNLFTSLYLYTYLHVGTPLQYYIRKKVDI